MKKIKRISTSGKSSPSEFCGLSEDEVLLRIEDGESISAIASSLGRNRSVLSRWLQADAQRSARAKESREVSAQAYDDAAEAGISGASDAFELSKAKELAHHLRWRASKIAPKVYGEKLALGGADDLPAMKTLPDDALIARIEALQAKLDGKSR